MERLESMRVKDSYLLSITEVAELLGCSQSTIRTMVRENKFPNPIRLGSLPRWRYAQIQLWELIETRRANPTP
jgi:excisionase family DNA binding protein